MSAMMEFCLRRNLLGALTYAPDYDQPIQRSSQGKQINQSLSPRLANTSTPGLRFWGRWGLGAPSPYNLGPSTIQSSTQDACGAGGYVEPEQVCAPRGLSDVSCELVCQMAKAGGNFMNTHYLIVDFTVHFFLGALGAS